jgi:hypothetical protein
VIGRLVVFALVYLAIARPAIAQRAPFPIPDPDPEVERKSFLVAEGLEVNLFAADPLLAKPIPRNAIRRSPGRRAEGRSKS